ncbi:MAG: tRNA (N6-isopentenyl adenosine(37)-C2)-methylthiotransferase MiaB [Bacilli bacterium]|nr:tRNA (N6-isopentenyl adenosine(37)-C2)-methylthiotransferase MiaB [Bacilli bacterium]
MAKCDFRSLPSIDEARNRHDKTKKEIDSRAVPPRVKAFAVGKKYYIHTYGCQANIRDEEIMAGYLEEAGFLRTENRSDADVAIINTCAVRENAEDKVYGEIGQFKANKEKNKDFILAVCGCMMQEEGKAQYLQKTYPFISLVFGTHNVNQLLSLINDVLINNKNLVDVKSFPGAVIENLPSSRLEDFKAFVNISYGCDKFCTYCIVPYTRGKERSRSEQDIVNECLSLVKDGYKEITLLGQNVNSYGLDLGDGSNFASLLEKVAKTGIPRLRFLTSYPSQFTDEMIEVMRKYPNIMKWLHFPVQSGSSSMLRRMGRRYTREEYLDIVKRLRQAMPDISLTTDIIVGFPNETEEEFEDTLSLCEEVRYASAFTFIFSPRKGTPAAKIKDETPNALKHERFDRLLKVIEKTTGEDSEKMIGKTYVVLVDGPSKKDSSVLTGYGENNKPVNFKGPSYLKGCFVPVKIIESHTYSLIGEMVGDPLIHKAKDVSYLMSVSPLFKEFLSISEELEKDEEIKELGEELIKCKKEMALSLDDKEKHSKAKEEYEKCLERIRNHPLLSNRESLISLVNDELMKIKELLQW